MQIFMPYESIIKSLRALDDVRLRKQVLESAQLISNVLHDYGCFSPYKKTHPHHPLTAWLGVRQNFRWHLRYFRAAAEEFEARFGKQHKSFVDLYPLGKGFDTNLLHEKKWDGVYNNTPHKDEEVHRAYKKTLHEKWRTGKAAPKWTGRSVPDFF